MAARRDRPRLPRAPGGGVRAAPDPAGALGDLLLRGDVAFAIPDATRPLDPRPALTALDEHLAGGRRVVVGLGLHRRMQPEELAPLAAWSPVQHDPDDAVPLGEVHGLPAAVGRAVAEADEVVAVGVCELHQYAGFSGGHKAVAVGCGGRASILALHARDRITAPGVRVGSVEGNPFRAAIDAIGERARCRLALCRVPAAGLWLAGDPAEVVREAARIARPWVPVRRRYRGAVLRVPAAKGRSVYQASRAATYLALSPSPPVVDGGELVVVAPLDEGLGSEAGFAEALARVRPPWRAFLDGAAPTGPGAQRAVVLALAARRFRLRFAGVRDPEPLRRLGIDATDGPPPSGPDWLEVPEPFVRLPQLTG